MHIKSFTKLLSRIRRIKKIRLAMTQHIKIECPSCSPEERVSHELIKLGISSGALP